jgi:hypothetical protein
MAVFDALPEPLRRAVASADIAYDPDVVTVWLKRSRHKARLVKKIRDRTARRGLPS